MSNVVNNQDKLLIKLFKRLLLYPSFKRLFFVYLKYQMHISKDTTVDIGGANPIIYNEELSI